MKPAAKSTKRWRNCQEKGDDIVYIDDRQENIDAGVVRGWQTILQTTPARTQSAIADLGLLEAR